MSEASEQTEAECVFCAAARSEDDPATLVVERGEDCFVILNKFPYTNGHLMVAPYDHIGSLGDLPEQTTAELMALVQRAIAALDQAYAPHGYNVGCNQGRAAGAGVEGHVHMHVVPRWGGDTNFMPVLGDTRVMPQTLDESFRVVKEALTS